ncbi:MAG: major capsid protein [Magnetococcales bacterium]|nr:major capsid protein [Magnetococcales bacterium]
MGLAANPFSGNAFGVVALTTSINLLPNNYGRIEELQLMPSKPVRVREIAIEERNGTLILIPTAQVGSPGAVGVRDKRKVRSFSIPHIPYDDVILPEEVQGIRAFGSEGDLNSMVIVLASHLQSMRDKHAITLEHLRMGALKGVILDANGSTIYDLYAEFGITPKTINFELDQNTTKLGTIKAKCLELKRHVEDNLRGEFMTGIRCMVSPEFFDAFTGHAEVHKAFEQWQQGEALRADQRKGFKFCDITFEEYRGQAPDSEGSTRRFIASGQGHAFPEGTSSTFCTYFAPADFNEAANTLGEPLYAKQEPRKFDRGTDLHTQSNPLPMCHRPGVLVKVTATA